jgi:hypothetical protein
MNLSMGTHRTRGLRAAILAGLVGFGAAACSDDDVTDPPTQDDKVLTVDADGRWAFVRLGETASEVTVSDRNSSTAWDIAFNATRVMLNGGAAGPGEVRGYCICQNANATDAQVQGMTPENQLAAFEAVTAASIPTDDAAWETDVLDPAIAGWYSYDFQTHTVTADPSQVWRIRGAGQNPEYAKFHVTDISDATQAGGRVTIEFAVQPAAGEPLGAAQTVVLDGRSGPVYFDFATGQVSDASNWDIVLDGFEIRINGGVSGDGNAAALHSLDEAFEDIDDPSDAPSAQFRADAYGGVFVEHPWYRYNLDGFHTIFPTFDVYLIDTGDRVYKVQITGYYSVTGDARTISFRYEPLS